MPAKYRIQFKSTKYAIPYRLDIHDASYSGAVIELAAANPPVVLRKDSDGIFSGTSLDIGIEVPASLPWGITDLYSSTARDHKVELYKSDVLVWAGYLVPEEYADPLTPPPFDIFLRAVDGIGTLKDFDFDVAPTAAHMTHLAVLQHCLAKLALELPTAILIRIWEDVHNTAHSPLSQTLISPAAFYDDGKPLTCDKVISRILNAYDPDITLTQHAGHWLITRDIDATANTYVVHNADGQLTATAAQLTATTALVSAAVYAPGKCFPIGALSRSFLAQNKKLTAEVNYLLSESCLTYRNAASDYVFLPDEGWVSSYLSYIDAGGYLPKSGRRVILSDGGFASYLGGSGVGGIISMIHHPVTVSGLAVQIKLNIASMHPTLTSFNTGVKVKLTIYDGTTYYYLSDTGWTTTDSAVSFSIPTIPVNTSTATLTELSLIAPAVPMVGNLFINVAETIIIDANNTRVAPAGILIGDVNMQYIRNDAQTPFESSLTADVLINSNAIKSASVECFGDAPSPESVAKEIWHAVFLRPDLSPTRAWRMGGDTASVGLLSILARSAASNNRTPRQQYSGTLMGAALSPNSIITHAGNGARAFRIISASHALHADELEVELRELLPYAEAQFQLPTSPVYGDAKNTLTTTDGANNYTVFGGNVGIGKRIHQLPQATTSEGKYIMVDKEGNESAEKYPYIEGLSKALFDSLFEVRGTSGNEYICAKLPFASVGEVSAYASSDFVIPSLWDALPTASATIKGGIKIGSGLSIDANGIVSVTSQGTIQTLALNGTTLSISGGNSVTIPATYTDVMARAACAAIGTVYDSARLAGVLASTYTRRDVAETISQPWTFTGVAIDNSQHSALSINRSSISYTSQILCKTAGSTYWATGIVDAGTNEYKIQRNNGGWSDSVVINYATGLISLKTTTINGDLIVNSSNEVIKIAYPSGAAGFIRGYKNGITKWYVGAGDYSDDVHLATYASANLHLCTGGSTRLIINSAGNVGIGYTDLINYPAYRLDVNGDIRGNWHRSNINHGLYIHDALVYFTNNGMMPEISSGTNELNMTCGSATLYVNYTQGRIRTVPSKWIWNAGQGLTSYADMEMGHIKSWGNIAATGEVTAYAASDKLLKTNIKPITNASDILRQLRAVEYDWNEIAMRLNPAKRDAPHSVSFIAQEWEKVLPWATHSIFGKYKSIDLNVMTGYLVAGWNEHDKEINQLSQRVSELEKQLKRA